MKKQYKVVLLLLTVTIINMSPESKAILNAADLGKSIFTKEGWDNVVLKEISSRETGYSEMPSIDEKTGEPLILKNTLSEKLYGQAHVYTIDPQEAWDRIIFYIHGGGYVFNGEAYHARLCDNLCSSLNAKVVLPFYNLAPQGNYREAYTLLNDVYADLLKLNKPICIMGDSAGGGLAAGFVMELKENSIKLPDKMVLLSPWVDITMSNPDIEKYESIDPMLSKYGLVEASTIWSNGDDKKDYRLSPLYGDVQGLPPTLITAGTAEILYPDNVLFYNKYKDNSLTCQLVAADGMFHAFPLWESFAESKQCYNMIIDFIK